ncbi:MAG: zinc-dependent metalloprotease [Cyclobacteriaceae bacterium]|nr:zinc-dependent metalloprotease [Cyclobacteriaceae bacterium]
MQVFTFIIFLTSSIVQASEKANKYDDIINNSILKEGFFNFYWNESEGKIFLEIHEWNKEFLYVSFLASGVGSNDIGLDRGQLGGTKIVRFERYGPKVLLIQSNYDYRAESKNSDERKSVEEAFAQSVLGGFSVAGEKEENVLIDISDFLVRDAHNVIGALKRSGQGSYSLDKSRSVIYHVNTKNFELNSEFEALLTFQGDPSGLYVRQVTPTPNSVTVRLRQSFITLQDDNYKKREFDPRAGFSAIHYMDYATSIEQDINKRFISRHRLQKKNPNKLLSEPVEPIVYYVDRGAPEPIRSALIEGASWWNEAFEAAGFKNAFRVKELPEGADPLDIRYNVIQWVHRSTRGWSYGASVRDPRTGEIIKGHVSLGSLRVRQDFLIAQGLLAPYEQGKPVSNKMTEMALARLRQLSAHEVGHTIGLAHNYIASTYDRGSVMDYPHPLIKLGSDGNIDLSDAYDVGIAEWDKVAIRYGYSEFAKDLDEKTELNNILMDGIEKGIVFLSDQDARPLGSAHPKAHLWDNGIDAADELLRILKIRKKALSDFSENNIPVGDPMANLEEVLVPVYFLHRYQTEAAVKVIGGLEYNYAIRGDGNYTTKLVEPKVQMKALEAVLETINPKQLALDESIIQLIPPKPLGYWRGRENVKTHTGLTFDPLAAAETSAKITIELLLNPQRCARLAEHHARENAQPSLDKILEHINSHIQNSAVDSDLEKEIQFIIGNLFVDELIHLSKNEYASSLVRATTRGFISDKINLSNEDYKDKYLKAKMEKYLKEPIVIQPSKSLMPPDGSPIGGGENSVKLQEGKCAGFH